MVDQHAEAREQRALAKWLDGRFPGLWFHPPNGGARHPTVANYLKQEGVKPGVPDVMIVLPFVYGSRYVGMAIEMKRPKQEGSKWSRPSNEQRGWLSQLARVGWYTTVAFGAEQAIEIVQRVYGDTPLPDETTRHCWRCMQIASPRMTSGKRSCRLPGIRTCGSTVQDVTLDRALELQGVNNAVPTDPKEALKLAMPTARAARKSSKETKDARGVTVVPASEFFKLLNKGKP